MQEPGVKPKQCYCATCDAEDNPYGWRTRMSVCPVCGNKRCPAAIHHNNQCRDKESMATSDQWKMVPVEPTEEMLATVANVDSATSNLAKGIYQTMLTAAPQPVKQQPISHDWDDQDRCRRCGDRDWYASATCTPKQLQQPAPAVYEEPTTEKPTREERLVKALRALIQTHFFGKGFEWKYREGITLEDLNPSLHKEIVDLLKTIRIEK